MCSGQVLLTWSRYVGKSAGRAGSAEEGVLEEAGGARLV